MYVNRNKTKLLLSHSTQQSSQQLQSPPDPLTQDRYIYRDPSWRAEDGAEDVEIARGDLYEKHIQPV